MSEAVTDANPSDPRPIPPEAPGPGECCESGCDPCVWDYHNQEMAHYRQALASWMERNPQG